MQSMAEIVDEVTNSCNVDQDWEEVDTLCFKANSYFHSSQFDSEEKNSLYRIDLDLIKDLDYGIPAL